MSCKTITRLLVSLIIVLFVYPINLHASSVENQATGFVERVVLGDNVKGSNILTNDMINQANTIYVIQHDYVMGDNIFIPDNCVLEFDGGSISGNYILKFHDTLLEGEIRFHNVIPLGTIRNSTSHVNWFLQNGDEASGIISYLISTSKRVIIDKGTWLVNRYIKLLSNVTIEGINPKDCVLKFDHDGFDTNTSWYGMFGTDDQSINNKYLYTQKDSDKEKKYKRNSVKIENVIFKNITFDKGPFVNPHSCIEFVQARNCNVYNCVFKYDKGNPTGLCNGTASVVFIYSKHCKIENNTCLDDVLVASSYSDYITIAKNSLYRVRATGIETDFGYHISVVDNYVKDNYGRESTVGINSADCIVRGNTIILTGEDGTNTNCFSCLTINHQIDNVRDASNYIIENNYLESSVSPITCLLVQCGKDLSIRKNTIRGKVKTDGSFIGIFGGVFDGLVVSDNIIEQLDMSINCYGIFFSNNSDLPKGRILEIGKNNVKAINGIYVSGIKKSIVCKNNVDGVYNGLIIKGDLSSVKDNVIKNCTNAIMAFCDILFERNSIQSCGAINVDRSNDTVIHNVKIINNVFESPRHYQFVNFKTAPQSLRVSNNTFDIAKSYSLTITNCISFSSDVTNTSNIASFEKKWRFKGNTIIGIQSGHSCDIYRFESPGTFKVNDKGVNTFYVK